MNFQPGETNIACTNLERSLTFYRDVIGMEVVEMEGGAIRLHLGNRYFLLLPFAKAPCNHAYPDHASMTFDLIVDDIQAALAHFQRQQVTIVGEVNAESGLFFVADPDGLVLEIVQNHR
jgi:catechol 2,3-dioxygenase-like lactoylglutathione lyase family enzyme